MGHLSDGDRKLRTPRHSLQMLSIQIDLDALAIIGPNVFCRVSAETIWPESGWAAVVGKLGKDQI